MRDEAVMAGRGRDRAMPARAFAARAGLAGAALALLLGGCTAWNDGTYRVASRISNAGAAVGAPWGGMTPPSPEDTLTIERVRAAAPPPNRLQTEPGDVWPGPLPPRSTLANPDAALRGIPDYQPATARGAALPPPQLPNFDPNPVVTPPPPRRPPYTRGSSSPPPPAVTVPPDPLLTVPPVAPTTAIPPPAPRTEGQVINTPTGPVVTSGGTDRVQSYNVPGGGTGTAIRDGNTTTLIGPDGRVQVVPTPRP